MKKILKRVSFILIFTIAFSLVFPLGTVFADGAYDTYKVREGDVLWKIADEYGITYEELKEINELKNVHLIYPGQMLKVPSEFKLFDENGQMIRTGRDADGKNGVVSTAHYEASKVGVDIIKNGGNAVDAAVAVGFALSAAEPYYSGIGGGGFMTIKFAKTGEVVFLDFRETAPKNASPDTWPKDKDGNWVGYYDMVGGPSIGVPGEVKGLLYALEKYGTMSRGKILEPAINLAENGFNVGPTFCDTLKDYYGFYSPYPETLKTFYKDGMPYEPGDLYLNKDLANTLRLIKDKGEDGFYKGQVAEAIVASAQEAGSILTLEDLANYEIKLRKPVVGTYRGYEIISSPPASSGGAHVVQILNILENFDIASLKVNSAEYVHLFSEAFKLAFTDRSKYMGDTDYVDVPLKGIIDKEYAKELSKKIDMNKAQAFEPGDPWIYESESTTHYSIMDKQGNMVAVTKSINYGSGVTAKGTGVMLNNHMADFSTGEGKPNSIEPGKRPLSSMSPTLVLKDGKPVMVVGSPGGTRIITTVAEVISKVIDHGMDIQEAIDSPRFFDGFGQIKIETRVDEDVINKLKEMGHEVTPTMDWDRYFGGVHAVIMKEDGILRGGADPRRDGKALGY